MKWVSEDQPWQFNRGASRRVRYRFCFNMKGKEPRVYGDKIDSSLLFLRQQWHCKCSARRLSTSLRVRQVGGLGTSQWRVCLCVLPWVLESFLAAVLWGVSSNKVIKPESDPCECQWPTEESAVDIRASLVLRYSLTLKKKQITHYLLSVLHR